MVYCSSADLSEDDRLLSDRQQELMFHGRRIWTRVNSGEKTSPPFAGERGTKDEWHGRHKTTISEWKGKMPSKAWMKMDDRGNLRNILRRSHRTVHGGADTDKGSFSGLDRDAGCATMDEQRSIFPEIERKSRVSVSVNGKHRRLEEWNDAGRENRSFASEGRHDVVLKRLKSTDYDVLARSKAASHCYSEEYDDIEDEIPLAVRMRREMAKQKSNRQRRVNDDDGGDGSGLSVLHPDKFDERFDRGEVEEDGHNADRSSRRLTVRAIDGFEDDAELSSKNEEMRKKARSLEHEVVIDLVDDSTEGATDDQSDHSHHDSPLFHSGFSHVREAPLSINVDLSRNADAARMPSRRKWRVRKPITSISGANRVQMKTHPMCDTALMTCSDGDIEGRIELKEPKSSEHEHWRHRFSFRTASSADEATTTPGHKKTASKLCQMEHDRRACSGIGRATPWSVNGHAIDRSIGISIDSSLKAKLLKKPSKKSEAEEIKQLANEILNKSRAQRAAETKKTKEAWKHAAMAWRKKNKPSAAEIDKRQAEDRRRMEGSSTKKKNFATARTQSYYDNHHHSAENGNTNGHRYWGDAKVTSGSGLTDGPLLRPSEGATESDWRSYFRLLNQRKISSPHLAFSDVLRVFKVTVTDASKLKEAYRTAVRMYHPDSNSQEKVWKTPLEKAEAEEIMKIINERKPLHLG